MENKKRGSEALVYCTLLALQFGLQPLLVQRFSGGDISKISLVIGTEIEKIIISMTSVFGEPESKRRSLFSSWSISKSLKYAALPAVLYAIQNLLTQYGYQNLDSMTFNLLSQTKVRLSFSY